MKDFHGTIILSIVALVAIIAMIMTVSLNPNDSNSLGQAVHLLYPAFSAPESGFIVSGNSLSVSDDAVYKTGYYSINGGAWQSFTLSGTTLGGSWLTGTATKTLPSFGPGEHYVVIYSCNKDTGSWNCYGSRWQLIVINDSVDVIVTNNVVDANNQFASDLYSRYQSKEGNMFFSPYSISSALAMTYEGAKGVTASEMRTVLHLPSDKETIHSGFVSINTELNKVDKTYILNVANALWAQKDFPFKTEYFNAVDTYYGGKVTNLDFKTETEKSRVTINSWVEDMTNDRIKELLPKNPPVIDADTKLVLTNAIYFKANWTNKFSASKTVDGQFKLNPGTSATAKMMHQTGYFNYTETDKVQMLEMDYLGNDLSMLIILPKENYASQVESGLTIEQHNSWKKDMTTEKVQVTMPKFKFETKYFMAGDLKAMGMPTAFSASADFTGMWNRQDNENLYISEVIHQTFIEVAENGTEAAAATAVVMGTTSIGPDPNYVPPKIFNADHPFIFIIQQKDSGNILFMGRMSDPR